MQLIRIILYPISFLYGCVVWLRNWFFDLGLLQSRKFDIPIIVIGNLNLGGTGKTPHAERIVTILKEEFQVACLSRGYGRSTKGFKVVETTSLASEVGDEPLQMKKKFPSIPFYVDEDRCAGIDQIIKKDNPRVVILDDAFQHRKLKGSLNILLINEQNPIDRDFYLPTGTLRDHKNQIKRADIIVITKSTEKSFSKSSWQKRLKTSNPNIFQSKIQYLDPDDEEKNRKVILVTGIENPTLLKEELRSKVDIKGHFDYRDHKAFNRSLAEEWFEKLTTEKAEKIITTEKDFQRILDLQLSADQMDKISFIPIEIKILETDEFSQLIKSHVLEF